jgi:3-oxoacyl-[acyl-carrier protein] reductase
MARLDGKTAVVSGAARGLGRAIARRLAADGARVVINYSRSYEAAKSLESEIAAAGGQALIAQADVTDIQAVREMFSDLQQRIDGLDILVNNAGQGGGGMIQDITPERFDATFGLNVRALFFVTQAALGLMREGGRIINLSSMSSHVRHAGLSVYGASKAAVDAFTRNWATELGPRGITVNSILPGLTETEMVAQMDPALRALYVSRTVFGRIGQPGDIADVVAFLASDEARWITGEELRASGGAYV